MGALITQIQSDIVEQVIIKGDLAQLTPPERVNYYRAVCDSVGLNPLTKPFEYIELDGKLTLYARRDATDQLRKIHNISVSITGRDKIEDVYIVTAKATTPDGRSDESTGVVSISKEDGEWKTAQSGKRYFVGNGTFKPLRCDALANALMKAETKSKRRVTLSICGLGWLDETEIETIPDAKPIKVSDDGKIDNGPSWSVECPTTPTPEPQAPPAPSAPPAPQATPENKKTAQAFSGQLLLAIVKKYKLTGGNREVLGALGKSTFITPADPDDLVHSWYERYHAYRANGDQPDAAAKAADDFIRASMESAAESAA